MLDIDGSAGGGQILRSALSLAVIEQRPVRIRNIRGNRPEPGCKPQHLAVVDALAEIADATVTDARQGAETIEFEPRQPAGGHVTAEIDTAGSISLLFDAVLGVAVALDEPLNVTATGGTEVKWSPPLVSHQRIKLPLCRQFGLQAAIERHRSGFYPAGGGSATLALAPSRLTELSLTERGPLQYARVHSIATTDLESNDVARRQAETARDRLDEAGIDIRSTEIRSVTAASTGTAVVIELVFAHSRAGFDALGEPGVPAETVAEQAAEEAVQFLDSTAAVDRHLGDQLLAFLALAGGEIRMPAVTDHVESHIALLDQFGYELRVDRSGEAVTVRSGSGSQGG